jgi:hypothetical protein
MNRPRAKGAVVYLQPGRVSSPATKFCSALPLLMTWLCATDNANNTFATNDFAVAANFLYRCTNFHDDTPNKLLRRD